MREGPSARPSRRFFCAASISCSIVALACAPVPVPLPLRRLQHLRPRPLQRRAGSLGRLAHRREERVFHLLDVGHRLLDLRLAQVGALVEHLLQRAPIRLHRLYQRRVHAGDGLVQQRVQVGTGQSAARCTGRGRPRPPC
jgi:hypothetical protein